MALAILEPGQFSPRSLEFTVDTGTNKYYQLKLGRKVRRAHGIDWVDDVYFSTALAADRGGSDLLASPTRVSIPANKLDVGGAYAQLFTFKTRDGRAPAFSDVIPLSALDTTAADNLPLLEMQSMSAPVIAFERPRRVTCRTGVEAFSESASVGDLLTQVMRLAAPIVADLLRGQAVGAAPATSAPAAPTPPGANLIVGLLDAVLRAVSGGTPAVGAQQSVTEFDNRFASPFIFGIDDAILASLVGSVAGPVLQVLPQLANAANQKRLGLTQANNKLITDILSDVTRRMMLQQVLDAQRQGGTGQPGSTTDLNQLAALLQQAPPPAAADAAPAAPVAVAPTQSLSMDSPSPGELSKRAVLTFVTAAAIPWLGANRVLFSKTRSVQLRVRLDVGAPVPKASLSKAILTLVFKDGASQETLLTKAAQLRDVPANTVIPVDFDRSDLAGLPTGVALTVLAELRWPGGRECVHKALGSTEITLVAGYFVKERGAEVGPERELTDMQRFKPFWNKVWEAPALDSTSNGQKRFLWELDTMAKYSVLLAADHDANGLMETKLSRGPQEAVTTVERVAGRMKAGIEVSVAELNKLAALWEGQSPLPPEKLEILKNKAFAKGASGEFTTALRLKGKTRDRGMVWVVPVFKLVEFTVANAQTTDDAGQVTAVTDEQIRFPVPTSARVLGLKSSDAEGEASDAGDYAFDGYEIEFNEKIMLTPIVTSREQ